MNIGNEKRFLKATRQKHQEIDLENELLLFKEKKKSLQGKISQKIFKRSLILIKEVKIHQEYITIFSIYTLNMDEPYFVRQVLLDVKADYPTQ